MANDGSPQKAETDARDASAFGRPPVVSSALSTGTVVASTEVEPLTDGAPLAPPGPKTSAVPPELAASKQYADVREIGRGGMGVVYKARNVMMNRMEVLKIVNKSLLDWPGAAERFIREIRSAAKLRHPNVVGAFSAQHFGDLLVFAMEYVEGVDLGKLLKSRGSLPAPNACYYIYQAALGLQHAHEKQMVHRDIKPSNLILTREGKKQVVKILDFGLAKGSGEKAIEDSLSGAGKLVLCTPDYVAPEQIKDSSKTDIRSDIYSLGCTLYYLISGRLPFAGQTVYDILAAHRSTESTPLSKWRPEVPVELSSLVAKMMAKEPAHRFQTPAEVAAALKPFFRPVLDVEVVQSSIVLTPVAEPQAAAVGENSNTPTKIATNPVRAIRDEHKPATRKRPRPAARRSKKARSPVSIVAQFVGGFAILALFIAWAAGAFKGKPPDEKKQTSSGVPASGNSGR